MRLVAANLNCKTFSRRLAHTYASADELRPQSQPTADREYHRVQNAKDKKRLHNARHRVSSAQNAPHEKLLSQSQTTTDSPKASLDQQHTLSRSRDIPLRDRSRPQLSDRETCHRCG